MDNVDRVLANAVGLKANKPFKKRRIEDPNGSLSRFAITKFSPELLEKEEWRKLLELLESGKLNISPISEIMFSEDTTPYILGEIIDFDFSFEKSLEALRDSLGAAFSVLGGRARKGKIEVVKYFMRKEEWKKILLSLEKDNEEEIDFLHVLIGGMIVRHRKTISILLEGMKELLPEEWK